MDNEDRLFSFLVQFFLIYKQYSFYKILLIRAMEDGNFLSIIYELDGKIMSSGF